MPEVSVQQALAFALQHHQGGRLAEAEALYRQILAVQPNQAEAWHHLGVIAHQTGRYDAAVEWIGRALKIAPDDAGILNDVGILLAGQKRFEEAVAHYDRAIHRDPDHADAHNNRGAALDELGRPHEAVAAYRRALQIRPDYVAAHYNLGDVLRLLGELDQAISSYECALRLAPNNVEAHNNLGVALADLGKLEEAAAEFQAAIQLQPNLANAWSNLGNALREGGQFDAALAAHRQAVRLGPELWEARNNLGNTLMNQGRLKEAIAAFRQALQLKPDHAGASSNLLYALHFQPGMDAAAIDQERRRWNREIDEPLKGTRRGHDRDRDPERRLRIGYVSPDFRDHVVGRNLIPLFKGHAARSHETVCYSGVVRPDHLTEEFRRRADVWRSTVGLGDEALAEVIQRDGVDILVDLTQHLEGNRLPVFARQPAPVQVSFAGYPESTGEEAIGYRISDRWMEAGKESISGRERSPSVPSLPAEQQEIGARSVSAPYLEGSTETVFLLDSFWCYDPCGMEVVVNELPAQESGRITFGCLNNFCKVNGAVLRLWARVMGTVPDSRLVVSSGFGSHRPRTLDFLAGEGVAAGRVEFVAPCGRREYLERYHRLDVVLDTFPYNGHTTSLDALWMGVPVVSLEGHTAVSRAGLSQLSNLGLPELVARSEEEYVEIAARLAGDLPRLAELRGTLRTRMEASVLMDAPCFARQIEAAYREMWRHWCAQKNEE